MKLLEAVNLLHQPAFALWREECVHEVVIGLVRDLEGLLLDVPVDGLQHIVGQVPPRVDPPILLDELLRRDLDLGVGVVEGGVEHDDGEGQDEAGVSLIKDVGILLAVMFSKCVHDAVNLHRFTR